MPKGYPCTQTCNNCDEGLPAEYSYCPYCGNSLFKEPRLKKELVQVKNPITHHYVLIDKSIGKIIKHGRTSKPYKNIPIAEPPPRKVAWLTKNPPPKRVSFTIRPKGEKPKRVSFLARR